MLRSLLSLLGLIGLLACSVTHRVTYEDEQGPIPQDVLDTIHNKDTEKGWVLAQLGEPFAIDRVQTHGDMPLTLYEVYTYRMERSYVKSGHILFILRAGGRLEEVEYLHVAFEDDRVQEAWTDSLSRAQLGARLHEIEGGTRVITAHKMDGQNKSIDWKIPILKKWFGPKGTPVTKEAMAQEKPQAEEMSSPAETSQPSAEIMTEDTSVAL